MGKLICMLLVGGLLWQLATFAVFLFTDGDEKTTALYSMGVFTGLIHLYYRIIYNRRLKYDRKQYNCYWMYEDGKHYPITHVFMNPEYAKQFETDSKKDNYIELIQFGADFLEPVDKAHVLTPEHSPKGMDKEYLRKYLKED